MDDKDPEKLRHSLAHLLAAAVLKLYPDAKITLGPAIENGFYYDFDFHHHDTNTRMETNDTNSQTTISEKDLVRIEKEMKKILPSWKEFSHKEVTEKEAREFCKDNPYKLELIDEIVSKGEKITLYTCGEFTDLCRGNHVENPSKDINPDAFKLDRIAGAYWRGDEKNKMLTRIYGLAFKTKEELEQFLANREEMAKRDHRKLGKELDLFTFSDLVGAGLPLFTPKGTILKNELQNALLRISQKYEVSPVSIPHIAKIELYKISGHAEKFNEELFTVNSHYDQEFAMKPVNCPHHTQIYASKPRSYRDLPIRYMESTMQYRDEKPGQIGGLTRTRGFTVDDGHTFCAPEQIKEEVTTLAKIIEEFYSNLGLYGNHWVSLSVRDYSSPEKYIGEQDDWNKAEQTLQEVSDELNLKAKKMEGEAAIYGPKLDYMFKDSLGNDRQLATIQLDFAMPKRFGLEYTDKDGGKKTPVMIHRAILGSYERFLALLIEHFAGAFPFWLSPVQVKILPIGENHIEYAKEITRKLKEAEIRAELDQSDETLGKKIRNVRAEKIPYWLVIGDQEKNKGTIKLESRDRGDLGSLEIEDLIKNLKENQGR